MRASVSNARFDTIARTLATRTSAVPVAGGGEGERALTRPRRALTDRMKSSPTMTDREVAAQHDRHSPEDRPRRSLETSSASDSPWWAERGVSRPRTNFAALIRNIERAVTRRSRSGLCCLLHHSMWQHRKRAIVEIHRKMEPISLANAEIAFR